MTTRSSSSNACFHATRASKGHCVCICFCSLYNSFIEIQVTYHKLHPSKMYNPVAFSDPLSCSTSPGSNSRTFSSLKNRSFTAISSRSPFPSHRPWQPLSVPTEWPLLALHIRGLTCSEASTLWPPWLTSFNLHDVFRVRPQAASLLTSLLLSSGIPWCARPVLLIQTLVVDICVVFAFWP